MQFIESFTRRKHGTEDVEYDHPILESILQEDLRHHRLSGTNSTSCPKTRWVLSRTRRYLAPCHGKEKTRSYGCPTRKIYSWLQKKLIKSKPNSPEPFLTISKNLPNTDSINHTLPPTASSPIKPPGSKRTIPANSWPHSSLAK